MSEGAQGEEKGKIGIATCRVSRAKIKRAAEAYICVAEGFRLYEQRKLRTILQLDDSHSDMDVQMGELGTTVGDIVCNFMMFDWS